MVNTTVNEKKVQENGTLTFIAETFKWVNKAKNENIAQKLSEESLHVNEFCSRYKQQRKGKKYALFLRLK